MVSSWLFDRLRRPGVVATEDEPSGPDAAMPPEAQAPSWQDMVRQLSDEVTTLLQAASEQLGRLDQLEPGLVRSLAPIHDAVERARQASMAARHVLRLCEDPPAQRREVLNLADVAYAALTARAEWLRQRRVGVRQAFAQAMVYADSSLLYQLVDELLLWVGQLGADISVSVEPARGTHGPRLQVISQRRPSSAPSAAWRGVRWVLWHQLARALGARSELDLQDQHVRVSVHLPAVTEAQLARSVDESFEPSTVSAVIQGCRVLIVAASAQRRAQCLQTLAGYGLVLDAVAGMHQAQQLALQRLPDAVVYDQSLSVSEVARLRRQLAEHSGTPAAFIEILDEDEGADFHTSTQGAESTGHVRASALGHSLGPALVFELCKVL
ncbi:MAG TPA: hypothetical protein PKA16_04405 [Ottowia sp.]|uniref:hypothetical protein n=1 Tax=Ottowia sp. TaxID=1898956 RepID=UPI002C7CDC57|nr:hypothetical protein [Ottowia sp.]HMN20617.1 hypothetical protein [Ottowia sp.]